MPRSTVLDRNTALPAAPELIHSPTVRKPQWPCKTLPQRQQDTSPAWKRAESSCPAQANLTAPPKQSAIHLFDYSTQRGTGGGFCGLWSRAGRERSLFLLGQKQSSSISLGGSISPGPQQTQSSHCLPRLKMSLCFSPSKSNSGQNYLAGSRAAF